MLLSSFSRAAKSLGHQKAFSSLFPLFCSFFSMALSRISLAVLVFALLALILIDDGLGFEPRSLLATKGDQETPPQGMDCGAACDARCRLSSRQRLCKRACGTCCSRCQCVPSGTSGNLDECPCYANMTTHGNRRKCP